MPTMIPVVFGDCAGWLHVPAEGSAVDRGIVLCDAFGYEALCTQRAMAMLGIMLADAGMPVLRFHYPGTGNSAGDETEGQIALWLDSIDAAISELRTRTSVSEVGLCGLRLGATLAVEAARRRADVVVIGMIMPVLYGRIYARELILSASMVTGGGDPAPDADWSEVLGYRLHRADLAWVRRIDLRATAGAGTAPRIVMVSPDETVRPSGPGLEVSIFPELSSLMGETEDVVIPMSAFRAVVAGLGLGAGHAVPSVVSTERTPVLALGDGVLESPVLFERDGQRFGILCRPAQDDRRNCVLILNTGLNHHTGNGRGSVRLARRLAARGIASLRIDAAGIGDSLPIDPFTPTGFHDLGRIKDVEKALDILEATGYATVTLVGICAGAYLGLHAAVADRRIGRAILANLPYFYVEEEDPRAPNWRKWLHIKPLWALKTRHARDTALAPSQPGRRGGVSRTEQLVRNLLDLHPTSGPIGTIRSIHVLRVWLQQRVLRPLRALLPDDFCLDRTDRMLATLRARSVPLLLAYSPEDPGLFEFRASFPDGGKRLIRLDWARIATIEDADHVMTIAEMQNAYTLLIEEELGIGPSRDPREPQSIEAPHFGRRGALATVSDRAH